MLEGVDVSYAQPNVDWGKVAGDVDFAVIKATEGRDFIDQAFTRERVEQAVKAFGAERVAFYHFARADTPSTDDAAAEARDFVQAVRSRGGELGRNGVLDYERAAAGNGNDEAWIRAWVREYRRLTGARPIIYGGSVLRDQGVGSTFGCPLWLAAYVDNPDPYVPAPWKKRGWRLWQFTDHGTVAGVNADVDLNRFRGTAAELRRMFSKSKPKGRK